VLHDVHLPEPCLVERVTGSVYDMAQPVLLGEHQHGIQKTFHGFHRLNECGSVFEVTMVKDLHA
jgi:hypothetical protein